MLNTIISISIFLIVLFLYIHIVFHHKKCDDLEVYVIEDMPHKNKWEELCDLKQPILLKSFPDTFISQGSLPKLEDEYPMFDINIKQHSQKYLPITLNEGIELLKNDSTYISNNNEDFLNETGIIKHIKSQDMILRPSMCSRCLYDIWFINNTFSISQFVFYHRTYIMPTFNDIEVALIPPQYTKYLDTITDYDTITFTSDYNPWNQSHDHPQWNKVKSLKVSVKPGELLYIPPYWWFSIKTSSMTSIYVFSYLTYMNMIAHIHHYTNYFLQKQNIKQDIVMNKITPTEKKNETKTNNYL